MRLSQSSPLLAATIHKYLLHRMLGLRFSFLAMAFALFFNACEKPEKLYPAPNSSAGLQTQSFAMGENYENQLFFNFSTQKTYSSPFGLWHIGFSCFSDTPYIVLNNGLNAYIACAYFPQYSIADIIPKDSLKKANWQFDDPSGHRDSMGFKQPFGALNLTGEAKAKTGVFVVDLGASLADSMRYIKIQLHNFGGGQFSFDHGYATEPYYTNTSLPIDTRYNFVYYNFQNQQSPLNEPTENTNWDVVFTTYKDAIYDSRGLLYPYVIRGVLINPLRIEVAQVNGIDFQQIDLAFAEQVKFTSVIDEIGYDWKAYDQNASRYAIVPKQNYLLRTRDGHIFKMRFLDFYNDQGVKGFPKMAWELLK